MGGGGGGGLKLSSIHALMKQIDSDLGGNGSDRELNDDSEFDLR